MSYPKSDSSPGVPDTGPKLPAADYEEFWEAPKHYWEEIVISEAEMGLIESGGADQHFLR